MYLPMNNEPLSGCAVRSQRTIQTKCLLSYKWTNMGPKKLMRIRSFSLYPEMNKTYI